MAIRKANAARQAFRQCLVAFATRHSLHQCVPAISIFVQVSQPAGDQGERERHRHFFLISHHDDVCEIS